VYPHWLDIFFPRWLDAAQQRSFHAERFSTVEVNYALLAAAAGTTMIIVT
jgi:hypothetical protein